MDIIVRNHYGALVGKPTNPQQIMSISSEAYYYIDDNYVIKNNNNLDVQTVPYACRGKVTGDLKLYYINGESNILHVYDIKKQKELYTYTYDSSITSLSVNDAYLWVQTEDQAYLYDTVYGSELANTQFPSYIVRTLSNTLDQYADYNIYTHKLIDVQGEQIVREYDNPNTYYYNNSNELVVHYDCNILWEDKFLLAEKLNTQNHV